MNFDPLKDAVRLTERWYEASLQDWNESQRINCFPLYFRTEERMKLYEDTKCLAKCIEGNASGTNRTSQIELICFKVLNVINEFSPETTLVLSEWIGKNTRQISENGKEGAYPAINDLIQAILKVKNSSKTVFYVKELIQIDQDSIKMLEKNKKNYLQILPKNVLSKIETFIDIQTFCSLTEVSKSQAKKMHSVIIQKLKNGETMQTIFGNEIETFAKSRCFKDWAVRALNEDVPFENLGIPWLAGVINGTQKECSKIVNMNLMGYRGDLEDLTLLKNFPHLQTLTLTNNYRNLYEVVQKKLSLASIKVNYAG